MSDDTFYPWDGTPEEQAAWVKAHPVERVPHSQLLVPEEESAGWHAAEVGTKTTDNG